MSGLPVVVSDPLLSFSAEVAVKSALVLAVAALAGLVLRKAHPAARHRAWALGILLAAAIPILVIALPGLQLPSRMASWLAAPPAKPTPAAGLPAEGPRFASQPESTSVAERSATRGPSSAPVDRPPATWFALAVFLAAAWALGSIALLGRIAVSLLRARGVARRGNALDLPELDQALRELGISRPIRLLESDEVQVPMTGGMIHPVLIVPAGFTGWSTECRRLVLLHELAHVRRADFLLNLGCEVAAALHWFQPLAWLAVRRVREEAEVAADDIVIATGAVPSTYASHLLAIVQGLPGRSRRPLMTVAMGATPIERRLKTILAPGRRLGGWRGRPAIPILAVALTGILAATRLAATPVERDEDNDAKSALATTERDGAPAESNSGESADDLATLVARAVRTAAARAERYVVHAHNFVVHHIHGHDHVQAKHEPSEDASGQDLSDSSDQGERAYERAQELHQEGEYKAAIEAWQEAIRLGYRKGTASYNLACSEARSGETEQALAALERAIDAGFDAGDYLERDRDLASLRSDARFQKLVAEYGGGDRERALARVEHLEHAGAQDFDTWYALGKELHAAGDYGAAIRAWRKSLAVEPGSANATYNIACAEALTGDPDAALQDLERAIELGFGSAEHLDQDEDFDSLRENEQFKRLVERARELELPDGAAGSWMAWRPDADVWRAAKQRYERQLELHPDSGRAWSDLGFARLRLGEHAGAADAFRTAFEKGYRPAPTAYNVACSYAAMHEPERAFEWLDRARGAGFDDDWMLASDPDLDNLRDDPRFPKVWGGRDKVKQEKQKAEWKRKESERKLDEY